MAQTTLSGFPKGEFAAFSTAKMTHFLPFTSETTSDDLDGFFKQDRQYVDLTTDTLTIALPDSVALIAQQGELIARFTNGKYKIISESYYHKNFNDPLVDEDAKGIY